MQKKQKGFIQEILFEIFYPKKISAQNFILFYIFVSCESTLNFVTLVTQHRNMLLPLVEKWPTFHYCFLFLAGNLASMFGDWRFHSLEKKNGKCLSTKTKPFINDEFVIRWPGGANGERRSPAFHRTRRHLHSTDDNENALPSYDSGGVLTKNGATTASLCSSLPTP